MANKRTKLNRLKSLYVKEEEKKKQAIARMKEIQSDIDAEELAVFKATMKENELSFDDALDAMSVFAEPAPHSSTNDGKEIEDEIL